jgi:hypothetical protein
MSTRKLEKPREAAEEVGGAKQLDLFETKEAKE